MSHVYRSEDPDLGQSRRELKFLKGTTTIGVKCSNGVVMASDRRASMETFIASKRARKTVQISDNVAVTISGSVADGQYLIINLKAIAKLYELELGKKMPVQAVARRLASILWSYRPYVLISHMIVGGYDSSGPRLFNVDPLGSMSEEDFIATGSGSPIAISVIEESYRPEIDLEEAKRLVISAMIAALERDMATGNGMDLAMVDQNGAHFFSEDEVQSLIDKVKAG